MRVFGHWCELPQHNLSAMQLGALFEFHGSDKSTRHNYHLIYGQLSNHLGDYPFNIFEIGIGTNDPALPSSMGVAGTPGASLRAFRDWAPKAQIYGGDIDASILFQEDRITTFEFDQRLDWNIQSGALVLPDWINLIVDDGLHEPEANFNTIRWGLKRLHPMGMLVVEDVFAAYLDQWLDWLPRNVTDRPYRLLQMKETFACIVGG